MHCGPEQFIMWLPLFTCSYNTKGTVSQWLSQHELATLTSSLKRSWRLISERSKHCFCSCSSSESGCLKYSIRSFSVCSTSSTKLATSMDPPSAMLSRALRGRAPLKNYTRSMDEHHRVVVGHVGAFVITWWSWWRGRWCCGWSEQRGTPRAGSAAG